MNYIDELYKYLDDDEMTEAKLSAVFHYFGAEYGVHVLVLPTSVKPHIEEMEVKHPDICYSQLTEKPYLINKNYIPVNRLPI